MVLCPYCHIDSISKAIHKHHLLTVHYDLFHKNVSNSSGILHRCPHCSYVTRGRKLSDHLATSHPDLWEKWRAAHDRAQKDLADIGDIGGTASNTLVSQGCETSPPLEGSNDEVRVVFYEGTRPLSESAAITT